MADEWDPFTREPILPSPENLARRSPVGQVLVRTRCAEGLTQQQVADRAGVLAPQLSMWETRAGISLESYEKLRAVLALPHPAAFESPRIVSNRTGQVVPPPENLAEEKAKVAALVIQAPRPADFYRETDDPPPPPAVIYHPDGRKEYPREGKTVFPDGRIAYIEDPEAQ